MTKLIFAVAILSVFMLNAAIVGVPAALVITAVVYLLMRPTIRDME